MNLAIFLNVLLSAVVFIVIVGMIDWTIRAPVAPPAQEPSGSRRRPAAPPRRPLDRRPGPGFIAVPGFMPAVVPGAFAF